MQSMAGIPISIISVIQGLVIIFVAAPAIIRALYHVHSAKKETPLPSHETGKPVPTSQSTKP
jgi:simple sugar transport system permease protein